MYLLATLANKNCANGMSWLVRKDALEQEGGLEFFKEYLAEDFFMSQALIDRFANMKENTCTLGEMKEKHFFFQRLESCSEHSAGITKSW